MGDGLAHDSLASGMTKPPIQFEVAGFEATGLADSSADVALYIDSYQFASSPAALIGDAPPGSSARTADWSLPGRCRFR